MYYPKSGNYNHFSGYKSYKKPGNKNNNNTYNMNHIQNRNTHIKEQNKKENQKKIFISFRNLNELVCKEDNEIIQFFMKYKDLSEVIKNTNFTTDMIYLMVEIMSKIVFINSGPATIILKQIIENTSFIEVNIKNCLINNELDEQKYLKFLLNLTIFSDKLLDKYSYISKRIKPGDLLDIEDILLYKQEQNNINGNEELVKKILIKIKQFKERERQININKLKEKERKEK